MKVILHGCNGKMGQKVTEVCNTDPGTHIVAGVDTCEVHSSYYPVFGNLDDIPADIVEQSDVVIDFSTAAAVDSLVDWCVRNSTPLVLCTTGLSEAQLKAVEEASDKIAILHSNNMSMGINLLMKVLHDAAPVLAHLGYDIEIVEKHHNQKVDAPSGTAVMIAEAVKKNTGEDYELVYDRTAKREKRGAKEIGISSVRGGTIVGDHDVIFAGTDEVITFSHSAYSKAVFAKGALQAAKYVAVRTMGLYTISDVTEVI